MLRLAGGQKIMLRPIATMQFARYGLIKVNLYLFWWVGGLVANGWVAGLNGNETNSAKLGN